MASGLEFGGMSGSPWAVGGGMDIHVPESPTGSPEAGQNALEGTLQEVKKTLWNMERHTSDTQSRLDVNNQSGPTFYNKKISRWAADDWGIDIMNETLPEIRDAVEELGQSKDNFLVRGLESIKDILANSAIARKSNSPLEESLAVIHESTVSFNEKTMRWHDDQSNLMVKGDDPRVEAATLKTSNRLVEAEIHWPSTIAGFLEEITTGVKLVVHRLYNPKEEKKEKEESAEEKEEGKTSDKNAEKIEKKQTTILGGMWESLKKSAKESWLLKNWKLILVGLAVLFAPLKWIKFAWEVLKGILNFAIEHPVAAAIIALSTWFIGGAFLSGIGIALAASVTKAIATKGFAGALGSAVGSIKGTFAKGVSNLGGAQKVIGGAALLAGVAMAIQDGFAGADLSAEWGVGKASGVAGAVLGGTSKGLEGAMANMGKWALIGAGIGSFFVPPVGTLIGGLIGAAVGAILGWIGGERIAKAFSAVGKWFAKQWEDIMQFFKNLWKDPIGTLKGLWKAWMGMYKSIGEWIWGNAIKPVTDWLGDLFGIDITGTLTKLAGKFADFGKWVYDNAIKPMVDWFANLFGKVWDYIKSMDPIGKLKEGYEAAKDFVFGGDDEEEDVPDKVPTADEKLEAKKQKLRNIIAEEQKEIAGGDDKKGFWGTSRQSIIDAAQKELTGLGVDDKKHRVNKAELAAKKSGKMSQAEYWKSEQGIADRTDDENNLIGMNKEEQTQLYEEYVGIRPKETASQISTPPRIQKALTSFRSDDKRTRKMSLSKLYDIFKSKDGKKAFDALTDEEKASPIFKQSRLKAVAQRKGWMAPNAPMSAKGLANAEAEPFYGSITAAQSPDDKMNTFNNVQEKNRTLQEEKSSSPVIITTDSKSIKNFAGDVNTLLPKPIHAQRIATSLNKD